MENIFEPVLFSPDHRGWRKEGASPLSAFSKLGVQHQRDMQCGTGPSGHEDVMLGVQRGSSSECLEVPGNVQKNPTFSGIAETCPAGRGEQLIDTKT